MGNLIRQHAYMLEQIGQALRGLKTSVFPLANGVCDSCLALGYLLAEYGGFCITNISCCTWINMIGQAEVNIKGIYA